MKIFVICVVVLSLVLYKTFYQQFIDEMNAIPDIMNSDEITEAMKEHQKVVDYFGMEKLRKMLTGIVKGLAVFVFVFDSGLLFALDVIAVLFTHTL